MNALCIGEKRSHDFYHISLYGVNLDDNGTAEVRAYGKDSVWLSVDCQGNNHPDRDDARRLYAWSAHFSNDIDTTEKARLVLAVLAKIEKGLARLAEEDGEPSDFADYCGRIARTLGISRFCTLSSGAWHYPAEYRPLSRAQGIDHIRRLDRDWCAETAQGMRAAA